MPDVPDLRAEVRAPEERDVVELFQRAQHVARGGLPLAFRNNPVLHANTPAGAIRERCDVARRVDPLHTRLQHRIHDDTVVDGQPRPFRELEIGAHTNSDDDEIRGDSVALIERNCIGADRGDGLLQ